MNFEIIQKGAFALIQTKVEKLDASNASDLKEALNNLNKSSVNLIVIDCSQTKYCDSSGLSALLMANRICKDTNGKFILCGLQPNVEKMIGIAQLDKVLNIVDTADIAAEEIVK